jgi:hypothetical protein
MAKACRVGVLIGLVAMAGSVGCSSGFATYPPPAGEAGEGNPNGFAVMTAMSAGLRSVIERYPPPAELVPADAGTLERPARIALNLLPGVRSEVAERTAERVGMASAPLFEGTADLPTYHVKRVQLRGTRAEVDVIRPLVTRRGARTTQMVTVELRSELGGYEFVRLREWTPGAFEAPEPFGYTQSSVAAAELAAFREARATAERLTRQADAAAEAAAELSREAADAEARARQAEMDAIDDSALAERAAQAWNGAAELRVRAASASARAAELRAAASAARAEAERLRPDADTGSSGDANGQSPGDSAPGSENGG